MKQMFFAVICLVLITMPTHAQSPEPSASGKSSASPSGRTLAPPADPGAGVWVGEWESRRGGGPMELRLDMKDGTVSGRVKTAGSYTCSEDWEKVAGARKGEKVYARYNLGGRCGNVDLIYTVDPQGKVLTGTWSSEYPGYGTFQLTKQLPAPN